MHLQQALLGFAPLLSALQSATALSLQNLPLATAATDQDITDAFDADGWVISGQIQAESGSRGFFAESKLSTTLDSGKPKKAYYVEGDGFDMGWLHGALSAEIGDAYQSCTTYLHHMPLNLLNEAWDQEMASQCDGWVPGQSMEPVTVGDVTVTCETYHALLDGIEIWLVSATRASYDREAEKIPADLVAEMKGFVAGALSKDKNCGCTFNKMLFMNYGIDVLMSSVYAGQLPSVLSTHAAIASPQLPARVIEELAAMPAKLFRNPVFCNFFGVNGEATKSGSDIFMGRDFQMPTGLVYQTLAADIVYVPTDGRIPTVSSGIPGFVGRVTGINAHGVTMGVDMLYASPNTPESPGLNSLLMVRHVLDNAKSTPGAIEIVASAPRGVTWLYPICDGNGVCVVIEAGKYLKPGESFNPLQYVSSQKVKDALPSAEFYEANPSPCLFDRGIFVRTMDFEYPSQYLDYNAGLYAVGGIAYEDSAAYWGETGYLFPTFEDDLNVTGCCLHSNFFLPQRETYSDTILISNIATTPEFRTAMMSYATDALEKVAHSATFRYDALNDVVSQSHGDIDIDQAIYIMEFLSPERTPGYWANTLNDDPMSAMVEGTMNVADIKKLRLHTKTGYWCDDWTFLTLKNFL
jgi:hypothetical protein